MDAKLKQKATGLCGLAIWHRAGFRAKPEFASSSSRDGGRLKGRSANEFLEESGLGKNCGSNQG